MFEIYVRMKDNMRNNLIINSEYERILLSEARKSGYCTENPYPDNVDWLSREESEIIDNELRGKITAQKVQNLFQMMILYDHVTIPSFIEWDDYSKLEETGYVKINTYDDMKYYMQEVFEDFDYEYGQYIKPAILPEIKKTIAAFNYSKKKSDLKFASIIYDLYLWSKIDKEQFEKVIYKNREMLAQNAEIYKTRVHLPIQFNGNTILNYLTFLFDWLEVHVDQLLWDLNLSNTLDGVIFNSEYNLGKLGVIQETDPRIDNKVYRTLKIELKRIIGTLPHANTLNDVFKIKEQRSKDIMRLRQVLDNLENELRNNGSKKMIEKAINEIRSASAELSKLKEVDAVSKWITYLSLPISVAEKAIGIPSEIGIGAGIISAYTTYKSGSILKKNNWITVIR